MDRRQIAIKLVLGALGLPVKLSTFDDRLIMQKVIYLAQAAGVRLGYYYRWYLRGPYCPSVTDDAFEVENVPNPASVFKGWALDDGSVEKLRNLTPLLKKPRHELASHLELLASIHFLIDRRQVSRPQPEAVTRALQAAGKPFNVHHVKAAMAEMRQYGLIAKVGAK